jgi:hypothetical protein
MKANRHPIDQLADLRAKIRELKDREDALRRVILGGRCSLVGDEFEATIKKQITSRLDQSAAIRELGLERLRPFMTSSETTVIRVRER